MGPGDAYIFPKGSQKLTNKNFMTVFIDCRSVYENVIRVNAPLHLRNHTETGLNPCYTSHNRTNKDLDRLLSKK